MPGISLFVGSLRVLLLKARRVGQDQRAEISRRRRREHLAAEALSDEPRQVAAVIEMGVRQNDGVDASGIDGERRPVPETELFETLKETAVDENAVLAEIEEMLRSRDRSGGAKEGERGQGGYFLLKDTPNCEPTKRTRRSWTCSKLR